MLVFNIMIHYSTSDVQQSPPDVAMHLKYSTDDTDVYVDMSNGDPAQYESKVDEAIWPCTTRWLPTQTLQLMGKYKIWTLPWSHDQNVVGL